MESKYISRLHRGFLKMVARQDAKKEIVKIPTKIMSYSAKHGEYRPLKVKHRNNKWNGMNLKELCRSLNRYTAPTVGMYAKRRINKEGKYILSMHGKEILKRKQKHA